MMVVCTKLLQPNSLFSCAVVRPEPFLFVAKILQERGEEVGKLFMHSYGL